MRHATLGILVLVIIATSGCVELAALLTGDLVLVPDGGTPVDPNGQNPPNDAEPPGNDDGMQPADMNPADRPTVRLSASNPNPLPNEQVQLTCTLASGSAGGLTYAFQPASARLAVDRQRGTGSFVVDRSDIGIEITFTCTATNSAGTSAASNTVTLIAVDPGPATFP